MLCKCRMHIYQSQMDPPPTGISLPRMAISDFYCYSSYKKITWQTYPPPTGISLPTMAISDFYCYSSYRKINWQTYPQSTGISWPRMAISDFYCYSSYRKINWQIYPPKYRYTLAKNGNFRFLCSHIGRSAGRSTPHYICLYYCIKYPVGCTHGLFIQLRVYNISVVQCMQFTSSYEKQLSVDFSYC